MLAPPAARRPAPAAANPEPESIRALLIAWDESRVARNFGAMLGLQARLRRAGVSIVCLGKRGDR